MDADEINEALQAARERSPEERQAELLHLMRAMTPAQRVIFLERGRELLAEQERERRSRIN